MRTSALPILGTVILCVVMVVVFSVVTPHNVRESREALAQRISEIRVETARTNALYVISQVGKYVDIERNSAYADASERFYNLTRLDQHGPGAPDLADDYIDVRKAALDALRVGGPDRADEARNQDYIFVISDMLQVRCNKLADLEVKARQAGNLEDVALYEEAQLVGLGESRALISVMLMSLGIEQENRGEVEELRKNTPLILL